MAACGQGVFLVMLQVGGVGGSRKVVGTVVRLGARVSFLADSSLWVLPLFSDITILPDITFFST